MSRLLILTRPELARGFHLAGVDAIGVPDVETAQEQIQRWLDQGLTGLLALDDGLLARMDEQFIRRLDDAEELTYILIPGGESLGVEYSRQYHIAKLIRRAVGVHITFEGEAVEDST